MDRSAIVFLAALGGGLIAVQAPVNARLRVAVGNPFLSAAISFVVGTLLLVLAVAFTGGFSGLSGASTAPWWAWIGGFAGAVLVTGTLVAAPRLGVTTTFVAVIAGQVLAAAIIDRFGWFGLTPRHLGVERIAALVLMLAALVLLLRE